MSATLQFTDTLQGVLADGSTILNDVDAWHAEQHSDPPEGQPFRQRDVRFVIRNKDGSTSRFMIATRWLRKGGMHFIHGGFMHEGCACNVSLPLSPRETMDVPGVIASCRHLTGRVHEVDVRFRDELHGSVLRLLARSRASRTLTDEEAAKLGGSLLCVDAGDQIARIEELVSDTQIEISRAANAADAIEQLKSHDFDAVSFELDLPDLDGEKFAKRAQRRCRTAAFIAVTGVADKSRLHAAIENGVRDIVMKPLSRARLLASLGNLLPMIEPEPEDADGEAPPTADDLDLALSRLKTAFERREFDAVLEWATALRRLGERVMSSALDKAGESALEELERSKSIAGSTPVLERLFFEAGEVIESLRGEEARAAA